MKVRRLEPSDLGLVASIDRSEHVEVQYRIDQGLLVATPASTATTQPSAVHLVCPLDGSSRAGHDELHRVAG